MPPADPELIRLLDDYASHRYAAGHEARGRRKDSLRVSGTYLRMANDVRAAIDAYIAMHYVRRDRVYADGPHDPDDGSAYAAALEAEGD